MPTIARIGSYRIYFVSHDMNEPPHVHVDRDTNSAKFWLDPVSLARNLGFRPKELRDIDRMVHEHRQEFLDAWDEYFNT